MKILEKQISPCKSGTVKIIPEEQDDLWLAYKLITVGDVITTQSSRKVHRSSDSGKKKNPSRVKVKLEIEVKTVDYNKNSSALRIHGKNRVVNEHVQPGSFHTLEVEVDKEFTLEKEVWDKQTMKTLEDGHDGTIGYDLGVVLMHEGLAHVFLVGKKGSRHCVKIEERRNPKSGFNKFFESVLRAFTKHIDFNMVRCVVIGSPGTIKAEFRRYLLSEAQRLKIKSIENNKSNIVLVNTSSGKEDSLSEVLHDMSFIKDKEAAVEMKAMNEFTDMLRSNSNRACYGLKSVEIAHELKAIETLMITDDLFRSAEIVLRQKYSGLVQSVKEAGGKALVFSSMHVWGEELAKMTGIAAILRFPLPDLDEMEL